jgi:hypothetical protein
MIAPATACATTPIATQASPQRWRSIVVANAKIPRNDLETTTRDVKARLAHITGAIEDILEQPDPIFADAKSVFSVFVELVLVRYEIDGAIDAVRVAWWPRP